MRTNPKAIGALKIILEMGKIGFKYLLQPRDRIFLSNASPEQRKEERGPHARKCTASVAKHISTGPAGCYPPVHTLEP